MKEYVSLAIFVIIVVIFLIINGFISNILGKKIGINSEFLFYLLGLIECIVSLAIFDNIYLF
jgi:hypothetical protein